MNKFKYVINKLEDKLMQASNEIENLEYLETENNEFNHSKN